MERLGIGLIGCGAVAEEYVKAFQADERSEVRALVSRHHANAERYRDRYNLQYVTETDAAAMLRMKNIDAVVVCTPHDTHTAYAVAPDRSAESGRPVTISELGLT
jgi:2-hydroxy-4-carboxymuconate semialdehyde hemiacetal dehydrogenase